MTEQEQPQLTGRLAVATPDLTDANFSHTVVLVLEHGQEGALGVVLNRPRTVEVGVLLPAWADLAAEPPVLFGGGPVQPDEAVIGLARGGQGPDVLPGVRVLDLEREPVDHPQVEIARLFVGYAGWGAGQLENEIASGGWFVVDGEPGDVFTATPQELWRTVLHRQGGVFRTVTEDPSLN